MTAAAAASSAMTNSGRTVRTGASRSRRPSSTSCITSDAVQSFVVEPIWNTESGVASTPVARLEHPGGSIDDLALGEDGERGARRAVLGGERGEPLVDPRFHVAKAAS